MNKFNDLLQLPVDWHKALKEEGVAIDLSKPTTELETLFKNKKNFYPETNDIYNAFKLCSFKDTKVVILGQDPYHQKGVANGLAFSVNKGKKIPASLRNIYKEIHSDLGVVTHHSGDLSSWARQGVLLINFSLTVEDSKPGSHFSIGWSNVVESVIEILNKKHNLVYLLWGANSISKRHLINEKRHVVFTAPHPSPLSAYRGFFGCRHFSKTNSFLLKNKIIPIDW
jgi:uracil-DNA glycosylase